MDFDKIKDAVNSIEMSDIMKNRIIENSNSIGKEKVTYLNFKRWISLAGVYAVLLATIIGIPFINKDGELRVINFTISAYAMDDEGNQL